MNTPIFAGDPWLEQQYPNGVWVDDARGSRFMLVRACIPSQGYLLCCATATDLWPWLAAGLIAWPALQLRLLQMWRFDLPEGSFTTRTFFAPAPLVLTNRPRPT